MGPRCVVCSLQRCFCKQLDSLRWAEGADIECCCLEWGPYGTGILAGSHLNNSPGHFSAQLLDAENPGITKKPCASQICSFIRLKPPPHLLYRCKDIKHHNMQVPGAQEACWRLEEASAAKSYR